MLSQGSKLILSLFILFLMYSCNEQGIVNNEQFSKELVGIKEYDMIYKQADDSLYNWAKNKLGLYQYHNNGIIYKVNKIFCFNKSKEKFVSCLMNQCTGIDCVQDDIWFFYGAKIKDTWYFFQGATIVLSREMYQKDVTKPLSFEKLHEIALKEVFSGYLMKKEPIVPFWKFWVEQEYEVDESYFDKHFRGQGWGGGDWIEDPDGSNGHWNGRIYTDEEFNKMYKEKALSVWPSSNPLTSFYDINIKRWRNIHQDSFDILLKAKKINPNGTAVE